MPDTGKTLRPGLTLLILPILLMAGMAVLQAFQLGTEAAEGAGDLAWPDYLLRRMGQYKPALFKPPANGLLLGAYLLCSMVMAGVFATHGLRPTTELPEDPDHA
ncbi:MAG: hypothetical protein VKP57_01635 [Candidatus Sericytochromatia bacterium]|nr:hypothetical protein [Candidatus Sericytochromatia bacterium]